jgi:tetratricopeptide (TPR) repeat protein
MTLKRKILVTLGVALPLLLLLAVFLLSTPTLDWIQRRIDRNPDPESSRWLQLTTADLCLATWRPEESAPRYRIFYERYTHDLRRAHALLCYAQALEEAGRNADAIDIYRKYLAEYPDHEERGDAEIGINRINNCRR